MSTYTAPCTVGRCTHTADCGRYTCTDCADRIRHHLGEIEDYHRVLDAEPGQGGGSQRRAPGFGSRSPARDDVIATNDRRSLPYVIGPDDQEHAVRPVLETLHHLAAWITEETGDDPRPARPTVTSEAGYLRSRVDWCIGQAWVDELAADIAELHGQLARLAGDPPPKPLAYCHCGGPLWPRGETDTIALRCGTCSASYDGLDLLRIGTEQADRAV